MQYNYELVAEYSTISPRVHHVCTRIDEVLNILQKEGLLAFRLEVYDNLKDCEVDVFTSIAEVEEWRSTLERDFAWKPFATEETGIIMKTETPKEAVTNCRTLGELVGIPKPDAVNPSHHKQFMVGEFQGQDVIFQWLEAQQFMPRFRNPESLKAAVELQVRKYLDRNGGKDPELQELQKALWYLKFLVAYVKNGDKPIAVADIEKILAS